MFQQTNHGISFKVKVVPKSSRNEIVGWEDEELKVKLAAVPEKGEANAELIDYLSEILNIGKSKIKLVKGEKSRRKRICITGLTEEQIKASLAKR
jgi:uncharacterized protein